MKRASVFTVIGLITGITFIGLQTSPAKAEPEGQHCTTIQAGGLNINTDNDPKVFKFNTSNSSNVIVDGDGDIPKHAKMTEAKCLPYFFNNADHSKTWGTEIKGRVNGRQVTCSNADAHAATCQGGCTNLIFQGKFCWN